MKVLAFAFFIVTAQIHRNNLQSIAEIINIQSVLIINGLSLKININSSISRFDNSFKWGTKLKRLVNNFYEAFLFILWN
ncbi:hypothetical protein A4D02_27550 [Niastella koreensis]|uniref:Uncharacterized protein n=2 Tax=Niastella koreensis TaxID=354356 RepID=G8THZ6_NIAKG|nr:hypothetical protein Niako_3275 [Niastella koreensis GR20-10]OQP50187.1 hypothetical protein A4D02_27550 [Niastella koreensis]